MSDIEGQVGFDGLLNDISSAAIDLDSLDVFSSAPEKDIFAEHVRKSWDKSVEARCDFERRVRLTKRSGVWFVSLWQKSIVGRTLTDIKSDPSMIEFFASQISPLVAELLGSQLAKGGWAICTTPKRRHKIKNFATLISERIATLLDIPFYEDVALCHSRQRVGAVFSLNVLPDEHNIIVFDDFVTTGQTLAAMKNLLTLHEKNVLFITGINNKL